MPGQKLTTASDSRFSYDQETGAVRSFFGAELVTKPEPEPEDHALASVNLAEPAGSNVEKEAGDFLKVNEDDFKLKRISLKQSLVREGSTTKSVQYQQLHHGVPVYRAELTLGFRASDGHVVSAVNSIDYSIPDSMQPDEVRLGSENAAEVVRKMLKNDHVRTISMEKPILFVYRHGLQRQDPPPQSASPFRAAMTERGTGIDGRLYWIWQMLVDTKAPDGNWEVLIDATNGTVIAVLDRRRYSLPKAYVFIPDPITSSQNDQLTWLDDASTLDEQREEVTLEDLDPPDATGMCYLNGKWVKCVDKEKPTASPPSSKGDFMYGSKDRDFLFAMTYYWTHELVKYLRGFEIKGLNDALTQIEIDAIGMEEQYSSGGFKQAENSHFTIQKGTPFISCGNGGVPDASDAHVIVHEYGHAVHHFLGCYLDCFEEGFGDFLAAAWLDRFNAHQYQREKVFPWDNNKHVNWGPERRLDIGKKFNDPQSSSYGKYQMGSIWAAALWELFISIGGAESNPKETRTTAADIVVKLYLEMLVLTQSYANQEQLANGLITADQTVNGNNGKYRQQICDAFAAKGVWNGSPPV